MAVGTWPAGKPDFETQSGTAYKTDLDGALAVARRVAGAFAVHEVASPVVSVANDTQVDTANDRFNVTAHGLVNGVQVAYTDSGADPPAPLVNGNTYFVVGVAANYFQLALTQGGAAINLTDTGTAGGTGTVTPGPSMLLEVDPGALWAETTAPNEVARQFTALITAPGANPRIDRIVLSAIGAVSILTGSEAASPSAPNLINGVIPLAQVLLATSTTAIDNTLITDERPGAFTFLREVVTDYGDVAVDLSGTAAHLVPRNAWHTPSSAARDHKLPTTGVYKGFTYRLTNGSSNYKVTVKSSDGTAIAAFLNGWIELESLTTAPTTPAHWRIVDGGGGARPIFLVTLSGNQNIASAAPIKITWDTETYDINANFASNKFTPTVPGYYQFNLSILIANNADGTCAVHIYKNGVSVQRYIYLVASGNGSYSYSLILQANGTTDYFEVYSDSNADTNYDVINTDSGFSGGLIAYA